MYDQKYWTRTLTHPKTSLLVIYTIWKLLLACIAFFSPGSGYDTSTSLLLPDEEVTNVVSWSEWFLETWLRNLIRWDAVYFTQIAREGYVWEQEWAFGWGFTKVLAFVSRLLIALGYENLPMIEALAGVTLSHVSHLMSVLLLHELTLVVYCALSQPQRSRLAVIAASLHIISPGGMFLSAPYAESSFSLLNFSGLYCHAKALERPSRTARVWRDALFIFSGIAFGVATTFRGNGLFSGLIFVYDAVACITMITRYGNIKSCIRRLLVTCISGTLMACIAALPQFLAYEEYCRGANANEAIRPWCRGWLPSIYGWVQKEYWGVGMLRYWTVSNLPLFLLAAPMLYILLYSGIWAWNADIQNKSFAAAQAEGEGGVRSPQVSSVHSAPALARNRAFRYAVPQMVLAMLALTTYHVQAITRISSGYPVWYWWLASLTLDDRVTSCLGKRFYPAKLITRWMIIYAIVQGGLFAGFLPPA